MKFIKRKLFFFVLVCLGVSGCWMNRITVGSDNMSGLKYAVDCDHQKAVEALEDAMNSDSEGYRRIAYSLAFAIKDKRGKEEIMDRFSNDSIIGDKDKAVFLEESSCLEDYVREKRLKKTGSSDCEVTSAR